MIEILILAIICYLLGSIPFAYLVPKLFVPFCYPRAGRRDPSSRQQKGENRGGQEELEARKEGEGRDLN